MRLIVPYESVDRDTGVSLQALFDNKRPTKKSRTLVSRMLDPDRLPASPIYASPPWR
jgi:hypothetical protein